MFNRFLLLFQFLLGCLVFSMAVRLIKSEFLYVMQFIQAPVVTAVIIAMLSIMAMWFSIKTLLRK